MATITYFHFCKLQTLANTIMGKMSLYILFTNKRLTLTSLLVSFKYTNELCYDL